MKLQTVLRICAAAIVFLCIPGCQKAVSAKQTAAETKKLSVQAAMQTTETPAAPVQPENAVSQPARDPNEPAPAIKMESSEHNFGNIGPNTSHTCQFAFSNVGTATLNITRVESTCSCSVPELTKKEYAPGEAGRVDVRFEAPTVAGPVAKHLYIVSNDPTVPRVELVLKATVELKISFEPQRLSLLLNRENAGLESIKITSQDGIKFAVKSFTAANKAISAVFDPSAMATEHTLELKAGQEALKSMNEGIIQIGLTHPENPQIVVPFSVLPMYEISRPRIILSDAAAGQPQVKEVLIKSNYNEPFEIESIQSAKGYMQVVSQVQEGAGIRLSVRITPPQQRYFTDEMTVTLKNGHKLSIRSSGWQRAGTGKGTR